MARTTRFELFQQVKSLLTEYISNKKKGVEHAFKYYRDKYGVKNQRVTAKWLDQFLHQPIFPDDNQLRAALDKVIDGNAQISACPKESSSCDSEKQTSSDQGLAKFSARQLIEELRKRGYQGELTYKYVVKL